MGGRDEDEAPPEVASAGAEVGLAEPPLDRGHCPMCDAEFDDRSAFREHLGEVHDLFDDEGAETDFLPPLLEPVEVRSALALPTSVAAATPPRTPPPPVERRRRPIGILLAVLAVVVLAAVGGVIALSGGDTDGAGVASGSGGATQLSVAPADAAAAATGAPAADEQPAAADGTAGATAAPVSASTVESVSALEPPSTQPADTTLPVSPPTTVSTQPPPPYAPPTTSGARIDSCVRKGSDLVVTYSWRFVGGVGWTSAYAPSGGGRNQATVTVPRHPDTTFTTVQVSDPGGAPHAVALSPALSTSGC
jgi:hypothetical protein